MVGSWFLTWEVWASLGAGLSVGGLVLIFGRVTRFFRRRKNEALGLNEEDLPWEDLLELLKKHNEGKPGNEQMSPEELLASLLEQQDTPSGVNWGPSPTDRRKSRRRWMNPIEVVVLSPLHDHPLHGLVINRSTGGLAILSDLPFETDTVLRVRPVDAPAGIGYIELSVRHSRQASRLWLIGCQYKQDVPWNVKVWFG